MPRKLLAIAAAGAIAAITLAAVQPVIAGPPLPPAEVDKEPESQTISQFDILSFQITVTNINQSSNYEAVTLADTLPPTGSSWQIDSQSGWETPCQITGGNQLNCGPTTLEEAGGSASVSVSSQVIACSGEQDVLSNTATSQSPGGPDSDTVEATVICRQLTALPRPPTIDFPIDPTDSLSFPVISPIQEPTDGGGDDDGDAAQDTRRPRTAPAEGADAAAAGSSGGARPRPTIGTGDSGVAGSESVATWQLVLVAILASALPAAYLLRRRLR